MAFRNSKGSYTCTRRMYCRTYAVVMICHMNSEQTSSFAPKKGSGACLYMPRMGVTAHWLANFEGIPAPPPICFFGLQRDENLPLKTVVSDHKLGKFGRLFSFTAKIMSSRSRRLSPLANMKGSLPSHSTRPDRLRSWTPTDGEASIAGFGFRTRSKHSFFDRVHDLVLIYTPKEAHSAGCS